MSPYLFNNIKVRITFRPPPKRNWRIWRFLRQHRYLDWRRCVDYISSAKIHRKIKLKTLRRSTALG